MVEIRWVVLRFVAAHCETVSLGAILVSTPFLSACQLLLCSAVSLLSSQLQLPPSGVAGHNSPGSHVTTGCHKAIRVLVQIMHFSDIGKDVFYNYLCW